MREACLNKVLLLLRSTTTNNDPLRPTTTPLRRPTTIHNDPLRPTTTPQRPTTIPKLPSVAILHDNKQYKLLFVDTPRIYYCKAFDPNPDLHANRWDLKRRE